MLLGLCQQQQQQWQAHQVAVQQHPVAELGASQSTKSPSAAEVVHLLLLLLLWQQVVGPGVRAVVGCELAGVPGLAWMGPWMQCLRGCQLLLTHSKRR
jgi:hypothetical protein